MIDSNPRPKEPQLERALTFIDAFSIVAGCIIGTGVFIKAAAMSQALSGVAPIMAAWIVGGLLSLCGALVYAEIGSLYPHAGGEYIYLRESFGNFWAYLYGWTRVLIAGPASMAAYAVGGASFLSAAIDLAPFGGISWVAIFFILAFSLINCFKVFVGGRLQTMLTLVKVGLVAAVAALLFTSDQGSLSLLFQKTESTPNFASFGAALIAALWAYDGWNNLPMIAGEVKNPKRNIPLSLIAGMGAVLVLYLSINLSYFYILPISEVSNSYSDLYPDAMTVATKALTVAFGTGSVVFMSVMFAVSALGGLNGSVMTSARVPFAMAKDGVFFHFLRNIHPTSHVPVSSIIFQGVVACMFAWSGKFDQITNYVVFSSWIFYALVTASIFKLRKKHGASHDGYKTWGYPYLPVVFIAVAVLLLGNTLWTSPRDSLIGLAIIVAGIPLYGFFRKSKGGVQ